MVHAVHLYQKIEMTYLFILLNSIPIKLCKHPQIGDLQFTIHFSKLQL